MEICVPEWQPALYTPPELIKIQQEYISRLTKVAPKKPFPGPVWLKIAFCFKSDEKHQPGIPKPTKPDLDNLEKGLVDCMTKCNFWNDRKKSKNAVLTVKPDYLKDLCSQAVAKEAAKLATDAKAGAMERSFEELIAIPVMVIHDHFAALMKKDGREERFAEMCLELYDTVEKGFVTPAELRQCLFEEAGGMMDIVMGFIIGTFAGSIGVTFTLCLFFVNAKRRDE